MRKLYGPVILFLVLFFAQKLFAESGIFESVKEIMSLIARTAPVSKFTESMVARPTTEINTSPGFKYSSIVRGRVTNHQHTLTFSGVNYVTTSNNDRKDSRVRPLQEPLPMILEPSGETNVNPLVIKVVVSAIPNATQYTVELNRKKNFSGASIMVTGFGNEFIVKNLDHSTTYFARVKSDLSSTYGPPISFTTRDKIKPKRLWGLTTAGGDYSSGTVFSFSVDSSVFTKHHDYQESSDYPTAYLRGTLVPAPDGGFYGVSECEKMGTCANGEVFYVSLEGKLELRYTLGVHAGDLMLGSDNNLYVVDDWINHFQGGIWKLDAEGAASYPLEDIIYKFSEPSQGLNPRTSLLELNNGYLYGVTPFGGISNAGTIFRMNREGREFQVLHHFDPAVSGANPNGSLSIGEDGYLYGTTAMGGATDQGVLFKILPDGNGFKKFFEFHGLDGKRPLGNLLHDGDILYGMTSEGGSLDKGVMFSLKRNGSSYRKLLDFNGENGAHPRGTPSLDDKRVLYAMTFRGGANDMGILFTIKTTGASFSKLYDFSEASGGNPDGNVVLTEDPFRPSPGLKGRSVNGLSQPVGYTGIAPLNPLSIGQMDALKGEGAKFIV